jgi:hypothetical protein
MDWDQGQDGLIFLREAEDLAMPPSRLEPAATAVATATLRRTPFLRVLGSI